MPELTNPDVRAVATALGLSLDDQDLIEITHRLNAFVSALAPLGTLPLRDAEPAPVDPTRIS